MFRRYLRKFIIYSYIFFLTMAPGSAYTLNMDSYIFPATEIISFYLLSSFDNIKFWLYFIFGLMIDQIYGFTLGTNAFALVTSALVLHHTSANLMKNQLHDLGIFTLCSLYIFCLRYLFTILTSHQDIDLYSLLFQLVTTIFFYPLAKLPLKKL